MSPQQPVTSNQMSGSYRVRLVAVLFFRMLRFYPYECGPALLFRHHVYPASEAFLGAVGELQDPITLSASPAWPVNPLSARMAVCAFSACAVWPMFSLFCRSVLCRPDPAQWHIAALFRVFVLRCFACGLFPSPGPNFISLCYEAQPLGLGDGDHS